MPSPKIASPKLLARRAAKVTLNHDALDAITRAVADGAFELAKSIISSASSHWPPSPSDSPPDTPPLREAGGVLLYVDRKLVGTWSMSGAPTVKKPRAAKLGPGIVVIGGYDFPAKFQEAGTIRQPARPVLTPELMADLPDAEGFIRLACVKHKVISAKRAAVRAAG
jgi:hypothetical protein